MKLTKFMNAVVMTAAITMGGLAAQAQQAGGSMVFLVQPEPPHNGGLCLNLRPDWPAWTKNL